MLLPFISSVASAQIVTTFGGPGDDVREDYAYKLDVIDVAQRVRLLEFEVWLDYELGAGANEDELLTFVVYAETTPDDYILLWDSGLVSVGVNAGFKSSGDIDLEVPAGARMAIGFVLDDGNYHFHFDDPLVPLDAGWGSIAGAVFSAEDETMFVPFNLNNVLVEPIGFEIRVTVEVFDEDGDGFDSDADCDDADATSFPGAPELCDGIDNDCTGVADDPVDHLYWYTDADGDGFGDDATEVDLCDGSAPAEGLVDVGGDCLDSDALSFPGAVEHCDGLDEDCDLSVDEDPVYTDGWADADGDRFGDLATPVPWCEREPPPGVSLVPTDCDDAWPSAWPGSPEVCDGHDNDCNGETDEGFDPVVYYADSDGDGAGDPATLVVTCDPTPPPGAAANSTDCDDGDHDRFPGNTEHCDGIDNDCDPTSGESEADSDGDGALDCEDCDADDPARFPGAPEICDGTDYDCDGQERPAVECDPTHEEKVAVPGCGCETGTSPAPLAGLLVLVWGRRRRVR